VRDDDRMTSAPISDDSNPDRIHLRRGVIYWIFRVIAGPLGLLMIAVGVRDFAIGIRGAGIRGILVGSFLAYYGITGGRSRWGRKPATTQMPPGDRPPPPIE